MAIASKAIKLARNAANSGSASVQPAFLMPFRPMLTHSACYTV